jgi:hypothetical protein
LLDFKFQDSENLEHSFRGYDTPNMVIEWVATLFRQRVWNSEDIHLHCVIIAVVQPQMRPRPELSASLPINYFLTIL